MTRFLLIFCFILAMIIPYLLCGINTAIIVTKIKSGEDIRKLGSGGAGLTNTLRTQGKTAALFVLIGDVLKGVLSVLIVEFLFFHVAGIDLTDKTSLLSCVPYFAGVFGVLGHVFPIYFGFKGGRGVLVTVSVLYAIDWVSASILLGIFIIIVAITRYVSLGSIIAGSLYPFCVLILCLMRGEASAYLNFTASAIIAALLIYMHRGNISRLRQGTENKLSFKKKTS